jgi:hypothetical protein
MGRRVIAEPTDGASARASAPRDLEDRAEARHRAELAARLASHPDRERVRRALRALQRSRGG